MTTRRQTAANSGMTVLLHTCTTGTTGVAHLAIGFPGLVAAPALQVTKLDGAELVRRAADVDDARRPA